MADIFQQYAQAQAGSSGLNPFENDLQTQSPLISVRTTIDEPIFSRVRIDFKYVFFGLFTFPKDLSH